MKNEEKAWLLALAVTGLLTFLAIFTVGCVDEQQYQAPAADPLDKVLALQVEADARDAADKAAGTFYVLKYPRSDIDRDGDVDMEDFRLFSRDWTRSDSRRKK